MGEPAGKRDRDAARIALGAREDASPDEVLSAYAHRSRVLKQQIIRAQDLEERDRARRLLRGLVQLRDRALGESEASGYRLQRSRAVQFLRTDDWSPAEGIPDSADDRQGGLAFFGIAQAEATPARVRQVFRARSGTIKEAIARARDNDELHHLQAMLARLQRILFTLLEAWEIDVLGVEASRQTTTESWSSERTRTDTRARQPSRGNRATNPGFAGWTDPKLPPSGERDPADPTEEGDEFDGQETLADS